MIKLTLTYCPICKLQLYQSKTGWVNCHSVNHYYRMSTINGNIEYEVLAYLIGGISFIFSNDKNIFTIFRKGNEFFRSNKPMSFSKENIEEFLILL